MSWHLRAADSTTPGSDVPPIHCLPKSARQIVLHHRRLHPRGGCPQLNQSAGPFAQVPLRWRPPVQVLADSKTEMNARENMTFQPQNVLALYLSLVWLAFDQTPRSGY